MAGSFANRFVSGFLLTALRVLRRARLLMFVSMVLFSWNFAGSAWAQFVPTDEKKIAADPDRPGDREPGYGVIRKGGEVDESDYLRRREEHIARLRGFEPGKPFDPTARHRAVQRMEWQQTMRDVMGTAFSFGIVSLTFPSWTELGPNPIPNGQTSPVNAVSGRVTAIEVDPSDPNKVYVGTAQGGVYRSLDGGLAWTPIFDSAETLAIGALTLDASNGRLYVGTGEPNGGYDGVGLYRIDDVNGEAILVGPINPIRSYTDVNGTPRSAPVFNGSSVSKILVVPSDPTTLFVSTVTGYIGIGSERPFGYTAPPLGLIGLYRLTSTAGTAANVAATRIAVTNSAGGCLDIPCTGYRNVNDMVLDPGDPTGATLIVWQNGTSTPGDGGIWRSTNAMSGSPTFTQSLITAATTTYDARGSFAIYRQGANPSVIYVASGEPSSSTSCTSATRAGALRVSTNGGLTFNKLTGGGGFCDGQCGFDIGLAVDPGATTSAADDIVYLAGIRSSPTNNCQLLAARSVNGGATFAESNGGVHPDTHVIKLAPSNPSIVYRGDDGGIWKSIDYGLNWASLNYSTFRATQFQSIAVHPTDPNFSIGGTQDNGTNNLTAASIWNRIDFGDGGYTLIDQTTISPTSVVMYHTYYNLANSVVGYANVDTSVVAAADNNWSFRGCLDGVTPANGINCSDSVLFYAPMALGPGSPNIVYYGTDRLYRSIDKGANHTIVSQAPLVTNFSISNIAVSPQDDNYRIIGLENGSLFYTTTGSSTLSVLDPTGAGSVIPDKYVARIVFDPTNKNTAYIAIGGYMGSTASASSHVWKVTNLSSTPVITSVNGSGFSGLPDVPVNGLAVDPTTTTRIFAGTDIGVYDSEDGGSTWSPFGLGLPRIPVFDMAVQNVKRVLRIATYARGMWEIALPPAATVIVNPPSGLTASTGMSTKVFINWTRAGTAVSYQIWRSSNNNAFAQVGTTTINSYPDTVSPNTTYLYKVKAVDGGSNVSPFSNMDYATTVVFTDEPLVAGTTTVKAVHLIELRTAVNAVRAAAGLTAINFTDTTVNSSLLIKAVHIDELRVALNGARTILGMSTLAFGNALITPIVSPIRALDVQEIRNGTK